MFEKLTVEGSKLVLGAGALVGLSAAQFKVRSHNLRSTSEEGIYELLQPMEFKLGEVIEIDPTVLSRAGQAALGAKGTDAAAAPAARKGKSGGAKSG